MIGFEGLRLWGENWMDMEMGGKKEPNRPREEVNLDTEQGNKAKGEATILRSGTLPIRCLRENLGREVFLVDISFIFPKNFLYFLQQSTSSL